MNQCKVLAAQSQEELPPLPVPFDEQAWGKILAWEAPIPGVYMLETKLDTAVYVVDRSRGSSVLPNGVFSYGIPYEDGKYVYFDYEHGRYVVQYEVLLYLSRHCPAHEKQAYLADALMDAVLGAEEYPGYFGPITPQHQTPWGRLARYLQVDNGVWLIQAGGVWVLGVCSALRSWLADSALKLSKPTPGMETDETGDLYWELEDCAPVVWDLLDQRPALREVITSMEDLECCLCELFPEYVEQYNEGRDEGKHIQKRDGSSICFFKLPI